MDPSGEVQTGALVVDIPTGEIQAFWLVVMIERVPHRVLDARRQIGSLVKPFVVAAAIEGDPRLHAGTLVRDEAVSIRDANSNVWAPKIMTRRSGVVVRLETVIASSINQATVHLGLDWGLIRFLIV